ncbi:MAG: spore cortex-lytic enzyme [Clostridia bacterium]|nr:spore cortex-lytic enzyme [Clostridia bacterium]
MKKIIKTTIIMLLVVAFAIFPSSALSKVGSTGDEVYTIQQILKQKGYYNGSLDGVFGTATKNAVMAFQKDNNLKVDGIAGKETLYALGLAGNDTYGGYSSSDYMLLARIISAEARGEEYLGQVAVGAVVMNRVEHPSFPDTVSGVVYQKGAFSCLDDGQFYEEVSDSAYNAATDVLNGLDPSGGAIYYYNPDKSTNRWILNRPVITKIGNHLFCS